jgi:hypothetical protein
MTSACAAGRPAALRRRRVEDENAVLDDARHERLEAQLQVGAAASARQKRDAVENFGDRDRRQREVGGIDRLQPGLDRGMRLGPHALRHDVGIEDDHARKSGGARSGGRSGSSRSTPCFGPNQARNASAIVCRFCFGARLVRRMTRASSSMERPCRAARIRDWPTDCTAINVCSAITPVKTLDVLGPASPARPRGFGKALNASLSGCAHPPPLAPVG